MQRDDRRIGFARTADRRGRFLGFWRTVGEICSRPAVRGGYKRFRELLSGAHGAGHAVAPRAKGQGYRGEAVA